MSTKKENIIRESFAETLDLLAFKIRHGSMTAGDIEAIVNLLKSEVCILVTVKELADFYHQSEDNIRHILHRKVASPPVRRVFYDFLSFQKSVPAKWHETASSASD